VARPTLSVKLADKGAWKRLATSSSQKRDRVDKVTGKVWLLEQSMSAAVQEHEQTLIYRPSQVLMRLPLKFSWEVTRRHPYYLHFWQASRTPVSGADSQAQAFHAVASALLLAIGFTGEPIDPALDFENLDEQQLLGAWGDGAIAPLTIRGFVGVLTLLPSPVRAAIGRFLVETSSGSDDVPDRFQRRKRLSELAIPELDQHPRLPMISVNLHAADRMILDAVRAQLRIWRRQFNVRAPRRHDALLRDYLRAWDMREGWTGSTYDACQEMRFREISRELRVPIRTIANRFASAFHLIAGHAYTPELWARIIGPIKLATLFLQPGETARISGRRPLKSKTRRPVPETVLQPRKKKQEQDQEGEEKGHDTGLVEAKSVIRDDIASVDLVMDIQTLVARGRSDQQIMEELELESDADARLVGYLRDRLTESRTGSSRRRASTT
jgi:hypothetical protein